MKNLKQTLTALLFCSAIFSLNAQNSVDDCPGIPGACGYPSVNTPPGKNSPQPLNGNGTLGQIYNVNKCGLNYVQASQRLKKRGSNGWGVNQPAPFVITGLPTCYVIEKAYIWSSMSGTAMNFNVTIVNPNLVSNTYPAVLIGTGADKCWGYGGTTTYRVDVTAAITGNGTYTISGYPTNPPTPQKDTDGATLFIIYSDPTANYEGHMVIHDGVVVGIGGNTAQTLTGINACANSTYARAFCMTGDWQLNGITGVWNGTPVAIPWNWWNFDQVATTVTSGQMTAAYTHAGLNDCYAWTVMGLYYRTTTCTTCPSSSTLLTLTPNSTQPTCNLCNGVVGVTVTGGNAPYTYSWVPGNNTTSSVSNLCGGTYTVYVFDAGCNQSSLVITLTSVNAVITSTNSTTPALCFGSCTGTGTSVPSGGTAPYTYSWYTVPSQNTATATGLCAGTYSVLVTDANGCTVVTSVTITQPTAVTGTITGTTQPSCFGGANGTATAAGSGGTPGYTYNWTPVGGTAATGTGLSAGTTYTCTITDANGCTGTVTVVLTQPPALSIQAQGFAETCLGACDGQVVCIPGGGTPTYTYLWSSGCTTPGCVPVCSGTYTITVTDANGCTIQDTANVSSPPGLTVTISSTPSLCGQANGSATVVATGGTQPYTYTWSSTPTQYTSTASNLMGGTYSVTVIDANGCSQTTSVVVATPAQVSAIVTSHTDVSCFGLCDGTANATATNGPAPYVYSWNSVPTQNVANAVGLCVGSYICYVTDANGCIDTAMITISQPALLVATASQSVAICIGGTTSISGLAVGGTTPYSYVWTIVGPGQSINVNPTSTQTYVLTVTDANGCTDTASTTITVNPLPVFNLSANDSDGCVTHCVTFGTTITGATSYAWTYGDGQTGTGATPYTCYSTTGAFNVTLVVTDPNGCSNTVTVNGMINVYPMPIAAFTMSTESASILSPDVCFNNTSVGGSTYSWDFGDIGSITNNSTVQNPCHTYTDTGTFCITLWVTSINGCRDSITDCVVIKPDFTFYAPNAITPDGDGINDDFFPQGTGWDPANYDLYIFDRWGNLIFQTDNVNMRWNGKVQGKTDLVQEDTYVWKVVLKDFEGGMHQYVGHVSVIR